MTTPKAFQDFYPDQWSHCYGCGRLNEHGHQIKSYWEGDETVAHFTPEPYHMAIPGYVYGGLIASLVDCHGTGTASAAAYRAENRPMDSQPPLRFMTGNLNVRYHKPTPLGPPIELRGQIREIRGRKVVVDIRVMVEGVVTASGEVIAIQIPEHMKLEPENPE
ncbi:MAG TPA: thioesterase [Chloroflexi bacterium]|nr:thioesterase [Chloroflexota bacterium]